MKKETPEEKRFKAVLKKLKPSKETLALVNYVGKDKYLLAAKLYVKVVLVVEYYNKGWLPNWEDVSEYKHLPYFIHKSPGFSFDGSFFYYVVSIGGSPFLYFKNEADTKKATKNFPTIYNNFLKTK